MAKSTVNIEENVASMLCYLGVWVTGIIFFLIEKENKTIRFHALQSLITFIGVFIIYFVLSAISIFIPFFWVLGVLFSVLIFILWIVLMIKAYQGEKFKLPIIGDIAEQNL